MTSRLAVFALGLVAAAAATAQPVATRTPSPAPRLSGGFGRPRATPPSDGSSGGQSFTDVVRAARDARHPESKPAQEKSSLTIDNRSLVTNPNKGRISSSKTTPAKEKPSTAATPAPAGTSPAPNAAKQEESTPDQNSEAQWRAAAGALRKRVGDARAKVSELEASVKKLETDFYAWDDGQYRDRVIKPAWDRTRSQLEDTRQELAAAEKDLADLPEKARVAGAMPGWVRE